VSSGSHQRQLTPCQSFIQPRGYFTLLDALAIALLNGLRERCTSGAHKSRCIQKVILPRAGLQMENWNIFFQNFRIGSYRRYFAIWMPEHTSKRCVVGVQNGRKDVTKKESESRAETTLDRTRNHERDMMGFRRDRSELRVCRKISRERQRIKCLPTQTHAFVPATRCHDIRAI
jgi:hypothetical protein